MGFPYSIPLGITSAKEKKRRGKESWDRWPQDLPFDPQDLGDHFL